MTARLDSGERTRLIGAAMPCRLLIVMICLTASGTPAAALVGGAAASEGAGAARHAVLIVGSRGNSCTGVAVARDLVLTVAHCVEPGADHKLVEFDANHRPTLRAVVRVVRHPQFDARMLRATADVALVKLAEPLPSGVAPAGLAGDRRVAVGERLVVAGYGVTVRGDGRTGGVARIATLTVTGRPGTLQIRLVDPATLGERAGLGACSGDSGAPVFEETTAAVIGLVSWSTGPKATDGCGGLTGVTPLALYRGWIIETARKLGSPLQ